MKLDESHLCSTCSRCPLLFSLEYPGHSPCPVIVWVCCSFADRSTSMCAVVSILCVSWYRYGWCMVGSKHCWTLRCCDCSKQLYFHLPPPTPAIHVGLALATIAIRRMKGNPLGMD